jgi:hypothetical protein
VVPKVLSKYISIEMNANNIPKVLLPVNPMNSLMVNGYSQATVHAGILSSMLYFRLLGKASYLYTETEGR